MTGKTLWEQINTQPAATTAATDGVLPIATFYTNAEMAAYAAGRAAGRKEMQAECAAVCYGVARQTVLNVDGTDSPLSIGKYKSAIACADAIQALTP